VQIVPAPVVPRPSRCELDNHAGIRSVVAARTRREGTLSADYISGVGAALDVHVFGLLPEDPRAAPAFAREQERHRS
jgi:hypothetical protein